MADTITVRMSADEQAQLESLRERLQARQDRIAPGVRVTQRMTILAALERLEAHLSKLERDKGRDR